MRHAQAMPPFPRPHYPRGGQPTTRPRLFKSERWGAQDHAGSHFGFLHESLLGDHSDSPSVPRGQGEGEPLPPMCRLRLGGTPEQLIGAEVVKGSESLTQAGGR